MKITLSQKWIDKMNSLPETGMGYQKANVRFRDGSVLKAIVLNSSEVIPDSDEYTSEEITMIDEDITSDDIDDITLAN